jgi:hypothetical protein
MLSKTIKHQNEWRIEVGKRIQDYSGQYEDSQRNRNDSKLNVGKEKVRSCLKRTLTQRAQNSYKKEAQTQFS